MGKLRWVVLAGAAALTAPSIIWAAAPTRPTAVSPGALDRSTVAAGTCPALSWSAFPGGRGYEIAVFAVSSAPASFDDEPRLTRTFGSPTFSWSPGRDECLAPGSYAWVVRAATAEGWSEWSAARFFAIEDASSDAELRRFVESLVDARLAERVAGERTAPVAPAPAAGAIGSSVNPPKTPTRRTSAAAATPPACQAGGEVFADVPATSPYCAWIEQFYRDGFTTGCGPGRFCPSSPVTRQQLAMAIERAFHARGQLEIDAGSYHTCSLLSNGRVICWGMNAQGQSSAPAAYFTAVSAGGEGTCAVKSDGTLACWGYNGWGAMTAPAGTFRAVTTSGYHSCGVRADGTAVCWGYDGNGAASPPAGAFTAISAAPGGGHTCGLKSDGGAACWGANDFGQTTVPAGTFLSVSAGLTHSCAVRTDGAAVCWGENGSGEAIPPAGRFVAVSAGVNHSCGVRVDGGITCWGRSAEGQSTPPAGSFSAVSAGRYYSCGIRADGGAACWGDNGAGQAMPPAWL